MKTTLMVMMAASAVLTGLTACSSDDAAPAAQQTREIRLGTTVGDVTRSNDATNLLNGDTVYVWADMVNPSTTPATVTEYFNAWALKANGVGGLSTLAAGNAKLFPATNMLNFYALVGNFGKKTVEEQEVPMITDGTTELPTTEGIRHTVLDDQTTAEAYYKSDLMYAVKLEQEPISDAVVLPFKHLLSRIQVVLVAGNGMTTTELATATVKLLDMKRQVIFTPDKSKDFTSATDLAAMVTIPATAQHSDILLSTNTVAAAADAIGDANKTAYADAIVVPQTIAWSTALIEVDYLSDGGNLRQTYYRLPDGTGTEETAFKIESGKQYRFRLVCDRLGETYTVVPTVADWTASTQSGGVWVE